MQERIEAWDIMRNSIADQVISQSGYATRDKAQALVFDPVINATPVSHLLASIHDSQFTRGKWGW